MKKLFFPIIFFIAITFIGCASTQSDKAKENTIETEQYPLEETLPVGPDVEKGQFDNGITYYIRKNHKPENRAELRLVVNAGSILENDKQQGLAHFTEHMAFNGTKHFEKQELVDYLESIGMRFGPDINAYTSFDQTVYMLQLPTDSTDVMEKGFQVLEDWAHLLSFDYEEIDKERGVVKEEWRLGRGADARMREEQYPVLFQGSRYAERLPIGKKAVIDTFDYSILTDFYNDWYRPDLMAVIAVGDFDTHHIKSLLTGHFAGMSPKPDATERTLYPVPDHEETLFAIASDPEATRSSVSIYFKRKPDPDKIVADYRKSIVEALYHNMFNQRLSELTQQADPPFIYGYSGAGQFVRTKAFYYLSAMVQDNGIPRGMEALLTEAERVKKYGFTPGEFQRQKKSIMRSKEKAYKERNKTESRRYASEYIRNYLYEEPIAGIEYEFEVYKQYVPTIQLEEVNRLAANLITEGNRVIMADSPEKEGLTVPSDADLQAVIDSVDSKQISAYVDDVKDQPLMSKAPDPSPIVSDTSFAELGISKWTLGNGINVLVKPTDFKNDEVRFTAFSYGGTSHVPDSNLVAAETATNVVEQGGLGDFSQIQLQKLLSDKVVNVSPYIGELSEGISGSASPQDLQTLFELIHLYFTSPRRDSTAFQSFKTRMKGVYANRSARPETAFRDTLTATLTQYHPRYEPWSLETLDAMDLGKSMRIYKERFADAGDFTFVFVGNFAPDTLKSYVERYIGCLPDVPGEEMWRDVTYTYPSDVIEKTVRKGMEPKSLTSIAFTGEFVWNRENRYIANALTDYLRIKFRERIREDLGGTYGVRVNSRFPHWPKERYKIEISFGADPERVQNLSEQIFAEIDSLKEFGVGEEYLQKIKEIDLRNHETNLKENRYWLNQIEFAMFHHTDPMNILTYTDMVKNLTAKDIQNAAQKYLNTDDYVQVTLYPEKQ
ncbi:MAG: Protein YhjJ [Candidatus Marinimicrobia bacterium]|nr:Protein YhjJ [Candidatus Neomarinimicrobiota bacterium]